VKYILTLSEIEERHIEQEVNCFFVQLLQYVCPQGTNAYCICSEKHIEHNGSFSVNSGKRIVFIISRKYKKFL
jgi:hypothetical protein